MDKFSQIKTPTGRVPIRGVSVDGTDLVFCVLTPEEVAARGPGAEPSVTLADLVAASAMRGHRRVPTEDCLALGKRTGPLFGGAERESLYDWASAVQLAETTARIQEVANGRQKPAPVGEYPGLNLERLTSLDGRESVDLATLVQRVGDAYASSLVGLPIAWRSVDRGHFLYAFATVNLIEGERIFSAVAARLPREANSAEFMELADAAMLSDDQAALMAEKVGVTDPLVDPSAAQFTYQALELAEDHRDILELVVRAVAGAHLGGVRLDVSRASDATGRLVFNSYLAWLWYGFSTHLDEVQIEYCLQCGRPFSLMGHRGVPRKYCSEACKTKAKNEATRRQRDHARDEFRAALYIYDAKLCQWQQKASPADELLVPRIAADVYPDRPRRQAEKTVRQHLSTWVWLRHEVEESVDAAGARSELLRRCYLEGLDMEKLLKGNSGMKVRHLLKELGGK